MRSLHTLLILIFLPSLLAHYFDFYPKLIITDNKDRSIYEIIEIKHAMKTYNWTSEKVTMFCFASTNSDYETDCAQKVSTDSLVSIVWMTNYNYN